MAKEDQEGQEKNKAWRQAGAPPKGARKKKKGVRHIYEGKNQFREKV